MPLKQLENSHLMQCMMWLLTRECAPPSPCPPQASLVSHEGQLLIYTLAPLFVLFMLVAPGAITFMLSKDTIEEARKRRIIQAMVRPLQVSFIGLAHRCARAGASMPACQDAREREECAARWNAGVCLCLIDLLVLRRFGSF